MNRSLNVLLGLVISALLSPRSARRERGLSQSTENAILLAGAAALATTVLVVVGAYVNARLPR